MKITICDPCKTLDEKIVETNRVMRVKGRSFLNIDICEKHGAEIKPKKMIEYTRYVLELRGIDTSKQTDIELQKVYL